MTIDGREPLVVLGLLLPVLYVSIFVHELGHAVIVRVVGFVVTSFGVGTGQPFLVLTVRGTRIFFCRSHPFQGITFCFMPQFSPPKRKMVAFLAGGIIGNSLLALGSLVLWKWLPWGEVLWLTIAGVNGILAVTNLIPFQTKVGTFVLRSDGRLILLALRRRTASMPAPVFIQFVKSLRGLWESIGDRLILQANLLASAAYWAELGDVERAEADFALVGPLPSNEPPSYRAREELVRAAIASGAGRLDLAATALDSADACVRKEADEAGLLYVALARAQLLMVRGDIPGALVELDALTSHPLVRHHAAIRIESVVARLSAAIVLSDMSAVEENLARYEAMRREQPSATRDLRVYRAVARYFAGNGDSRKAEPAFRAVALAINDLAFAWADPADLARFLQLQTALLTQTGDCLRALDKAEDAERLVEPLLSIERFQRKIADVPLERNRRLFRIGLRVMLVNVLCIVGLIGLAALLMYLQPDGTPAIVLVMFAFQFICFTTLAALYVLFHATIGRLLPALRHGGGAVILILSCLPWLSVIFVPIFFLLGPV